MVEADLKGWKYYLVFTVCSFTNALTFYLLFPEVRSMRINVPHIQLIT